MPTETERGSRNRRLLVVGGLGAIAIGVVAAVALLPSAPRPVVYLHTTPEGATVTFDGARLPCHTPCELPVDRPGMHEVQATLDGYQLLQERVEIPARGERRPTFALKAVEKPVVRPVVEPAAPVQVPLSFRSEPPGATVTIGGVEKGKTPLEVLLTAGETVAVKLELEGFAAVTEGFEVPAEAGAPHDFTLKALKKDPPVVVAHRPPPDPGHRLPPPDPGHKTPPPPPPVPEAKGSGSVRVVVKNGWATVECPPFKLGDTPFGDKVLPAGEYKCTFVNAELQQKRTQVVTIEPNKLQVVKVNFDE